MFLFSRWFFIFYQFYPQIGRDASRLYALLGRVHSGKGCTRPRRSVNNTHFIIIYFVGRYGRPHLRFYFSNLPQGNYQIQEVTPWLL